MSTTTTANLTATLTWTQRDDQGEISFVDKGAVNGDFDFTAGSRHWDGK